MRARARRRADSAGSMRRIIRRGTVNGALIRRRVGWRRSSAMG